MVLKLAFARTTMHFITGCNRTMAYFQHNMLMHLCKIQSKSFLHALLNILQLVHLICSNRWNALGVC